MTGRSLSSVAKPFAIAIGLAATVIATPVMGLVTVAAWQQQDPASLRLLVHELSVLAKTDAGSRPADNVMAAADPRPGQPG